MKVKFGLGANVLAIKKRNLNDISTFIDQETEVGNPMSRIPDQTQNCNSRKRLCSTLYFFNTSGRKQRKKIRWTWRESACGKR